MIEYQSIEGGWALAFMGLGWQEVVIILIVLLVLFGGSQLPKLARRLGQGVTEFKKGVTDVKDEFEKGLADSDKKTPPADTDQKKDNPPPSA